MHAPTKKDAAEVAVTLTEELWSRLRREAARLGVAVEWLVAGLICFGLYYYVPAMLGMLTGRPLYVVGSSTFGATGGYLIPGILMGLLQIGWFAVGTFVSAQFILNGLGMDPTPGTVPFIVAGVIWGYIMGSPPQMETMGAPHSSTAVRHSSTGIRSVMVDSYSRMRPQPVQVRLQACKLLIQARLALHLKLPCGV